ncbi:MAG TPA: hypothetical protein VFA22_12385 [Stellaceae bacterium]|nr:hypothetical protein [Stellaceae bacterium]
MASDGGGNPDTAPDRRKRNAGIVAAACAALALFAFLNGRGGAPAQVGKPPNCTLEPVPGPMRCANPNDPSSVYSLKHALFAFAELPVGGGRKPDPVCILYKPLDLLQGYDVEISRWASPDAPAAKPYYDFMYYAIDLKARRMTITELDVNRQATKPGLKLTLYDVPQRGWPCRPVNWAMLLGNNRIDPADVPDRR